ncbi:MAG: T9SS type A sorting domain-containing protein [Ignavibacteriae bacterium]|nr:T9SS C-terminal target domain-containing protein [Ignavibacteriota bacterium]NOG98602.1 T9SS type A sorting domain-containing protein [Ignavibacteriota bacterium]
MITGPLQAHETTAKYKVTVKDLGGLESDYSHEVEARVEGEALEKVIAVNLQGNIYNYGLDQNYPNPFNPTTSIKYSVKEKGFVSLKVYDMLGKEVADLVNETVDVGHHSAKFNASELPSGIYIYSIRVNDFSQSRKMLVLK